MESGRVDALDLVGAGAERNFERRFAEIARLAVGAFGFPIVLGQDRELAEDVGQLAVALHVEREGHLVLAGLLAFDDVLVVAGVLRMRLLQRLETEDDVLGRDGRAVVEARLGSEAEGRRAVVGRIGYPFGDKAILGRFLVGTARHERVVDHAGAGGRDALDRVGIERVEGPPRQSAVSVPPFGASGLTQSKFLKSAGYLGSSMRERA